MNPDMNNDAINQNSNEISQDASNVPNQPKPELAAEKRPISEARLAANRANAQKSTGPRTPEGKQRSCMNATATTSYAKSSTSPAKTWPPTTNSPAATSKPSNPKEP